MGKVKNLGYALMEQIENLEEQVIRTAELEEVLQELARAVSRYLDPDEPSYEWEDGVIKALNKANILLGE